MLNKHVFVIVNVSEVNNEWESEYNSETGKFTHHHNDNIELVYYDSLEDAWEAVSKLPEDINRDNISIAKLEIFEEDEKEDFNSLSINN